MPDGPVVALIVLVAGLTLLGVALFVLEARKHGGRGARQHARDAAPLPLFGTDRLAARGSETRSTPSSVPRVTPTTPLAATSPAVPAPTPRPASRPAAERLPEYAPRPTPATARDRAVRFDYETPTAAMTAAPVSGAPSVGTPLRDGAADGGAESGRNGTSHRYEPRAALTPDLETTAPPRATRARVARPVSAPVPTPPAAAPAVSTDAPPSPRDALTADTPYVEGETLRFAIPQDGTLQFLPGRLEVVSGPDTGREIRFVKTPGSSGTEVTFGRSEGAAYRHVQLHARTVSRQHAVMSLLDDHWQLTNLSTTNPVVLNGRVLGHQELAPLLVEGDRIEMGEVVFLFHGR